MNIYYCWLYCYTATQYYWRRSKTKKKRNEREKKNISKHFSFVLHKKSFQYISLSLQHQSGMTMRAIDKCIWMIGWRSRFKNRQGPWKISKVFFFLRNIRSFLFIWYIALYIAYTRTTLNWKHQQQVLK